MYDALTYMRGTRISRLLKVKNFLNNYFNMYKRKSRTRICMGLASPDYLGLRIT